MTTRRNLLLLATTCALTRVAMGTPVEETDKDKTLLFPNYFNAPVFARYVRIIQTAYAAIGYKVVIEQMPIERGLVQSSTGVAAGEIARIPTVIEKQFPDLMRVPVQMDWLSVSSLSKASSMAAPSLEKASTMRVGIVRGFKIIEAWTSSWPQVERVTSTIQLLKMLDAGNIDVILGFTDEMNDVIANSGFSPTLFNIREIDRLPQYHYLHKSHAALIPAISAEFKKIKGKYGTVVEGFKARGDK